MRLDEMLTRITAGGHSRREQQTHQQDMVSVNPSRIQAATSISHLLLVPWVTAAAAQGNTDACPFLPLHP